MCTCTLPYNEEVAIGGRSSEPRHHAGASPTLHTGTMTNAVKHDNGSESFHLLSEMKDVTATIKGVVSHRNPDDNARPTPDAVCATSFAWDPQHIDRGTLPVMLGHEVAGDFRFPEISGMHLAPQANFLCSNIQLSRC